MKIGIILHPYGEKQPGGLPRIIFGWASALIKTHPENEYIIYLKDKPVKKPALPPGNWHVEVLGSGKLWMYNLRKATKADVYLFNTPVLPIMFKPGPSVLITLDYPYKYLSAKDWKEKIWRELVGWYHGRSMRFADKIIAVSQSTKNDTMKFFNILEYKISVIYHGFIDFSIITEQKVNVPDKFFFFAGTIKERKNVLNIIKAFEVFRKKHKGYKFVIGGKSEGKYYENMLKYIDEHKLKEDVVFLGHLNESMLSYVYKRATALVFPSIVEGTGFPILEAMSCGTPSITSKIFGPAELGGNAAILIDPHDHIDIAHGMSQVADSPALVEKLRANMPAQMSKFSWDNAGEETFELLTEVVEKHNE